MYLVVVVIIIIYDIKSEFLMAFIVFCVRRETKDMYSP